MSDGEIALQTGRVAKMDQVRAYFEYLLKAEESGDRFPVDLEAVYPLAYTTKFAAKRALITAKEFYQDVDYHIHNPVDVVERPQGGGSQPEKIVLSVQCFEYFIARKNRAVFEVYRECRIKLTEMARARANEAGLPYHIRRYLANQDQVPFGCFSILQEITLKLIAPLEIQGYTLPEKMVPDISVGKIFCGWLRKEKGLDPASFLTYQHKYEDGRVVDARAYPLDLLPDFINHFQTVWMTQRAIDYFEERDDTVLPLLQKMIDKAGGPRAIADV